MGIYNTLRSYGSVAKFFHWLVFLLVTGMLIYGFLLDDIPKAYQGTAYNIHKLIGLSILILIILRAGWALTNPKPDPLQGTRFIERVAEKTVHWALYLAIIGMPLAGWIGSSAAGHPPRIGNGVLMFPIAKSKATQELAFQFHEWLAWTIIALVSIHVLAALYHQFIRRDAVLGRMLPSRRQH